MLFGLPVAAVLLHSQPYLLRLFVPATEGSSEFGNDGKGKLQL